MKGFIVGLGKMGTMHYNAMVANGIDVIAGFDNAEKNAQSFADQTGVPALPADHLEAEVLRFAPEFVSVATTTPARYELVMSLMRHESVKHIFVEKPFSSSLAQMSEVVLESRRRKKKLAINHQMMFLPQYIAVSDLLAEGELGELTSINVSGANFGLANKVSHYFEAFRWITGSAVDRVSAVFDKETIGSHRGPEFRDFSGRVTAWNAENEFLFVDFSAKNRIGIFVTYNFEFGKVFVDEIGGRAFLAKMTKGMDTSLHIPYPSQEGLKELTIRPGGIDVGTQDVVSGFLQGDKFPGIDAIENSMRAIVGSILSARQNGKVVSLLGTELTEVWEEKFHWS